MADFIEVLSPSALANLQKANAELTTMIRNVATLGSSMGSLTIPSNNDAEVRRLNADLLRQQQIIRDLQTQITSLANARQQNNTRTAEEIVNQRTLAQNADRQARANSALVGAYANLNAQHQIASIRLQNLIARGRQATQTQSQYNRELRTAQRDFEGLNRRVLSADQAVGRFNRNVGNYPRQAVMGIKDLIGAFGIAGGVTLFATVVKDIFQTTKELQSLDNALKQVTSTQENFIEQQQFLTRISEAYGAEIQGLTKQFTQFYVSAKDKLSGQEIQGVFESITKAGASMGLSVQSQERAFLALNQMMSKGTIQAEELRGQLGEALPGAFGIMAKAVGVTEKELGKMMKEGKLLADEVLPKFAKQLEITYGIENKTRIDSLAASTNRFSNTWTEFVRNLNDSPTGGISSFFSAIVKGADWALGKLGNIITSFDELRQKAEKSGKIKGVTSFNEQFKEDFKPLTNEQKAIIKNRIAEINKEILTATNAEQGKLRGEQEGLLMQLFSADSERVKATIATVASDTYREYAKEYNELHRKTVALAKNLSGADFTAFVNRGVDPKRKVELKELMAQELEVYRLATKTGEAIVKNKSIEDDDKKKREKIHLNYAEAKSEYNLKIAILERQKVQINDRLENEDLSLDIRLKARQEFSEKSIEILELETKKEKALINEKYLDDLQKNNLAYKNKDITSKEWSDNIKHLNNRLSNELQTIDLDYSLSWNELMNSNAKFYRDIQDKKKEYTEQTNKLIYESEKASFDKLANDAKKTLTTRQKAFEQSLDLSQKELQLNKIKDLSNAKSKEEIELINQKYTDALKNLNELESPLKKAREETEEFINKLSNGALEKGLSDLGFESAKMFLDFDKNGQTTFDKLMEGADTFAERFAVTFNGISEIAKEAFEFISEASNANFENEYNNLEKQKNVALLFAGDSASAREEIERQYEEKQKAIRRREFQAQKAQALFNIAINTAQGIVSALASTPPNVPLSIAIGAIGLVQAGVVASRQIPEFWKGTDNAPEGFALTQERGREIITDKHGNIKSTGSDKGAQLTYLNKGDKVLNNDKTMDFLMFNSDLNNILANNQIGTPIVNLQNNATDLTPVVNAINNKPTTNININKQGLDVYVKNGHTNKEITNRRTSFRGYGV